SIAIANNISGFDSRNHHANSTTYTHTHTHSRALLNGPNCLFQDKKKNQLVVARFGQSISYSKNFFFYSHSTKLVSCTSYLLLFLAFIVDLIGCQHVLYAYSGIQNLAESYQTWGHH